MPSESSSESSACGETAERGEAKWSSCEAENALLPWLLSCPTIQKALPVRAVSSSSAQAPMRVRRGADGVALVEGEMEEEDEGEEAFAGVGLP